MRQAVPLLRRTPRAGARGFTLVEAMIVLAIVGILAAYAVPSMRDMIQASKLRTASSDFYGALIQARSEAIKRRASVTVTPAAAGWTGGWTITTGATTLAAHDALDPSINVQVNVPGVSASAITYGMNGRVSTASQNVIFYITPSVAQPRCMSIDPSGMPRSRTDTNLTASDGCN